MSDRFLVEIIGRLRLNSTCPGMDPIHASTVLICSTRALNPRLFIIRLKLDAFSSNRIASVSNSTTTEV